MSGEGVRRGPFTFTRARVLPAAVVVVVLIIGIPLPYLTLGYEDFASQPVRPTLALWPMAALMRVLSLTYLPASADVGPDTLQRGVDFLTLGSTAHQVGLVVVILTIWGLFMDEINKFLWWPLHLAGWILVLGTVALWVGLLIFHSAGVDAQLGPGWVPFLLAGIAVLVLTFGSRSRIDSYRGA
jgi:hypothetical protein